MYVYDSQIVHPTHPPPPPANVSNHFILYILLIILSQMGKITKNNIFQRFILYI